MKLTHVGLAGAVAAFVLSGVSDFDRTAVQADARVAEASAATQGSETPKAAPRQKDQVDEQDAKGRKEAPRHKKKYPRRHHSGRFDTDEIPDADDEGETALACN